MSAWEYLKPAKEEPDPPEGKDVDAAEKNQVKGETKQLVKKDIATVNNVLRHVDDFYDDLASARDALWEAMSHNNKLSDLFDKPKAIKRISRMMVYLRLKRQIEFHNWNVKQLKEQIPYWGELFDKDVEIEEFIDEDDYFPINVGTSKANNASAYVSKALKERNDFPNKPRKNTKLRENMQTVIHYCIDKFDAYALSTFFKVVYKHLIGKSINEVDDSVDDVHLRYMFQKMKETRKNKQRKAVMDRKAQKKKKAVTGGDVQRFIHGKQDAEQKQSEATRNKGGGKATRNKGGGKGRQSSTIDSSNASTNSSSSNNNKKKKEKRRGPSSSNGR